MVEDRGAWCATVHWVEKSQTWLSHWTTTTSPPAAAKSLQSCPTLYDPIDGSPPGSPVPGILQAIVLEWIAISFSRGSSLTQGSNPGLPLCKQTLYHLSHQGSPKELKKNFKKLKNDSKNSKNISKTFSGIVLDSMGSVHFRIVPWSSLYFSRSIGPFLCSQY